MKYIDDTLYVDIEILEYELTLTDEHPKRIRVFFGRLYRDYFEPEVETIQQFPNEIQIELRKYIKNIFKKEEL